MNQTYDNWELILVDDNSTDKTLKIIKDFSCEKIKVFTSPGSGVSFARNEGIKRSSGEYFMFIDVDDSFVPEYIEKMIDAILKENTEVVLCGYYEVYSKNKMENSLPWSGYYDNDSILHEILPNILYPIHREKKVWFPVWRTILSRESIEKINFDINVSTAEDFLFMLEVFLKSKSVFFLDENLYFYNRNAGSSLNSYISKNMDKQRHSHEAMLKLLKKYNVFETLRERYLLNRESMYTTAISNAVRNKNKREIDKELKKIYKEFKNDKLLKNKVRVFQNEFKVSCPLLLLQMGCLRLLKLIFIFKEFLRLRKFKDA
ncbi:glycosyltransferase [Liquorilactobacillus mali]|uniref:Glycosyltransferase n=2 Tax=Liquorilactobacillus mali TaxID=1618 RepID=A0A0R2FXK6_9LACO|nr:glycosyltransferase [Liquorilactobacillus mali]